MSFEDEVRKRARNSFEKVKADSKIPAISYGITYQGQLIAKDDLGFIDQRNQIPADSNSIYPIASMTKSFAGAAILLLRDRGLLALSDRVTNYIPQLKKDPHWEEITIHDLVTMSAGLPEDNAWGDRQLGKSDLEFSKIYERGAHGEFVYCSPRGSCTAYSNLSYMMLGRVISIAAKEHALSFILKNLIEPLGMSSTCWGTDYFSASRYAMGYGIDNAEISTVSSVGDGAVFGGIFSSVNDILLWVNFLIECDNIQFEEVLSRKSRLELRSRGKILEDEGARGKVGYSYGIVTSYLHKSRIVSFGHSGGLPGFGSRMTFIPEHQLAIVALANITYAPVPTVCDQLADELVAILPVQEHKSSPFIEVRFGELISLVQSWSDKAANETFASNFFLDNDINLIKSKFLRVKSLIGNTNCTLIAEKYLSAKVQLGQKTILSFSLAPLEFGKVQAISFLD